MDVRDLEPDLAKPFVILIAHALNRAVLFFSRASRLARATPFSLFMASRDLRMAEGRLFMASDI